MKEEEDKLSLASFLPPPFPPPRFSARIPRRRCAFALHIPPSILRFLPTTTIPSLYCLHVALLSRAAAP